jgi:four helix bundle protein
MDSNELKGRTKQFALAIIKLIRGQKKDYVSEVMLRQLIKSFTSVAANYRAACRAKSKADFINKIAIVEEEADESHFWLELLTESGILSLEETKVHLDEANQLTAIFTSIRKTANIK